MTKEEAFEKYLIETFDEEFDSTDARHLAFKRVFMAGWEAAND